MFLKVGGGSRFEHGVENGNKNICGFGHINMTKSINKDELMIHNGD